MQIIINKDEQGVIEVTFNTTENEDKISYDDLINTLLIVMENSTLQIIHASETKEDVEHLYDVLDTLFYNFMTRTFPDVQPRDFDFSDAAILYAQDKIIEEAEKEGISFEEAMNRYEERAKALVSSWAHPM